MCSASTIAWRMSSSARDVSAISPLRTPRERAWPRPTILSAPSAPSSPTTAQTLEVPTSNPTMIEDGSNMLLFQAERFGEARGGQGEGAGLEPPGGNVIVDRQIERGNGLVLLLGMIKNLVPA